MTDFLVSIAGWLGEFLLNFFDFVFFLAFLLCLFICLGHAFGYSILSGKAQRSLGLVFSLRTRLHHPISYRRFLLHDGHQTRIFIEPDLFDDP